jgi:hypothetical protein
MRDGTGLETVGQEGVGDGFAERESLLDRNVENLGVKRALSVMQT